MTRIITAITVMVRFHCSLTSGDSYIKCYGGEEHGQVDLLESFAESCNASFANLGLSISVDKMNEVANSLLFNQALPDEVYDG